jgi:hypothetical protein
MKITSDFVCGTKVKFIWIRWHVSSTKGRTASCPQRAAGRHTRRRSRPWVSAPFDRWTLRAPWQPICDGSFFVGRAAPDSEGAPVSVVAALRPGFLALARISRGLPKRTKQVSARLRLAGPEDFHDSTHKRDLFCPSRSVRRPYERIDRANSRSKF